MSDLPRGTLYPAALYKIYQPLLDCYSENSLAPHQEDVLTPSSPCYEQWLNYQQKVGVELLHLYHDDFEETGSKRSVDATSVLLNFVLWPSLQCHKNEVAGRNIKGANPCAEPLAFLLSNTRGLRERFATQYNNIHELKNNYLKFSATQPELSQEESVAQFCEGYDALETEFDKATVCSGLLNVLLD
eukprot:TRINITY_DN13618_c0_g1_i1.p1 TRINITY_DN13618_c0_g1~~TRINITY_DN13618_c0_g1_i1.p1  ORF type:complete len:194 (+),score=49.23 TRINITY_DN13618_c0_g1_i1:23-583(+)